MKVQAILKLFFYLIPYPKESHSCWNLKTLHDPFIFLHCLHIYIIYFLFFSKTHKMLNIFNTIILHLKIQHTKKGLVPIIIHQNKFSDSVWTQGIFQIASPHSISVFSFSLLMKTNYHHIQYQFLFILMKNEKKYTYMYVLYEWRANIEYTLEIRISLFSQGQSSI